MSKNYMNKLESGSEDLSSEEFRELLEDCLEATRAYEERHPEEQEEEEEEELSPQEKLAIFKEWLRLATPQEVRQLFDEAREAGPPPPARKPRRGRKPT
jgi:hypothetical protein